MLACDLKSLINWIYFEIIQTSCMVIVWRICIVLRNKFDCFWRSSDSTLVLWMWSTCTMNEKTFGFYYCFYDKSKKKKGKIIIVVNWPIFSYSLFDMFNLIIWFEFPCKQMVNRRCCSSLIAASSGFTRHHIQKMVIHILCLWSILAQNWMNSKENIRIKTNRF